MPTYEYVCNACEHAFEEFQSITAKPLRKCPGCGKLKLQRLIGTGAGILFKGSGFYETDYRSEGYSKAQKADAQPAAPKSEAPAGDASKADAKPASQPASQPAKKPAGKSESPKGNGSSKS